MGLVTSKSLNAPPLKTASQEVSRLLANWQRSERVREKGGDTGVARAYKAHRKHPELFDTTTGWRPEWFDPAFLAAWQSPTPLAWKALVTEHVPGAVFTCTVFSDKFCEMLMDEINHFPTTGLHARRPNSMNNYGLILSEIGLGPMIEILQDNLLTEIFAQWWPDIGPFDGHHTFNIRYKEGEDLGLDMHVDDSDVTFNACLGKSFTGAELHFCGIMGQKDHRHHTFTLQHKPGQAVIHLGRLRHGAADITSGERFNLVVWSHSSKYRSSSAYTNPPYLKEGGPPDAVCLSYTHDRDYGVFNAYTEKDEDFQGRGWCPKRGFEYAGFKPEEVPDGGVKHKLKE